MWYLPDRAVGKEIRRAADGKYLATGPAWSNTDTTQPTMSKRGGRSPTGRFLSFNCVGQK
jgi:hypothetical protein